MPSNAPSNGAPLQASIQTILEDRLCSTCGYNLKGLDASGVCPECGESCASGVSRAGRRVIDNSEAGQATLAYLLPLGLALFMCGLSGLTLARFSHLVIVLTSDAYEIKVGLAASSLWVIGLLLLMRERPKPSSGSPADAEEAPWLLKLVITITQPAWIAVAAFAHLELAAQPSAAPAKWIALTVAALGLPAVPWLLSCTAEWTMSLTLAGWLRNAAWCLAFGVLVSAPIQLLWQTQWNWPSLLLFPEALARLLWFGGFLVTALFSLQLVIDLRWAIINARERAESSRRIAERRRRYDASLPQATYVEPPAIIPADVANQLEDAASAAPPPQQQYQHLDDARIEPGKDVKPYPLEDSAPAAEPRP